MAKTNAQRKADKTRDDHAKSVKKRRDAAAKKESERLARLAKAKKAAEREARVRARTKAGRERVRVNLNKEIAARKGK